MIVFESTIVELQKVTNQEFLDAIFGHLRPNERIWVTAFEDKPSESTKWTGWPIEETSFVKDYKRTITTSDSSPSERLMAALPSTSISCQD